MGSSGAGDLERMIMLAIVRLGDDAYGASILDELERRTGRDTKAGAVYVVLKRLEVKGFVASRAGTRTPERGGRPKRYVRVLPEGLAHLREADADWRRMTDGLGSLLGES